MSLLKSIIDDENIYRFVPEHNYRYERKFTVPLEYSIRYLELQIRKNRGLFKEVFELRQVNNIYFDTPNYQFYFDNVLGIADRVKLRIRWYGDTFGDILNPKLEVKIKKGVVGDKLTFTLAPFKLDNTITDSRLKEMFRNSNLPKPILEFANKLFPTLLNSYSRKYFLSADKKYRFTTDFDIIYRKISRNLNNFNLQSMKNCHNVLELKYNTTDDKNSHLISNQFSFRMDKTSKYVNGVEKFQTFKNV